MPALIIIVVIILAIFWSCIKVVPQAQNYIVERLGAYQATWDTGLHLKLPFLDKVARRVNMKEQVADFPPQHVITKDNYVVGQIYSIKGKNGYYNLLNKAGHYQVETPGESMIWDIPAELICATSVTISDVQYELQNGFFFITQEPVDWFKIGEVWYDVIR